MASWFTGAFGKNGTSLCLLRSNNVVTYQNSASKKLCGTHAGDLCPQTCVYTCEKIQERPLEENGIQLFKNMRLGKEFFDILFYSALPFRLVMFYPLKQKFEAWAKRLKDHDLSRRETEIAGLRLQGFNNSAISQKLSISKATLKTHLNNIYKKMPEARFETGRKAPTAPRPARTPLSTV